MITISNLSKSFGSLNVLNDVSIEIQKGEIFGIIGHSGAGKSTLLRCINGLETYQSGSIYVDDQEVSSLDKKSLHRLQNQMGMIFQNFNLLSRLNVYDNIALPLKFSSKKYSKEEIHAKIEKLLKLVGLEDKAKSKPRQLSGGQKQRVAIARALVLDPKVLLCDEATSALDPQTTNEILALLKKINEELGLTIVVVTHQMEVVKQICQRVSYLEGGKLVATDKPENLFIQPVNDSIKSFLQEESQHLPTTGVNIQLFFVDETSKLPVVTQLARHLDMDFGICWARLEDFRNNVLGSLVINVTEKDKDKVIQYLDKVGVKWEVLK